MEKLKSILVTAVFALVIFGLAIANLITPDEENSLSERRKKAQFPELSAETVFSAEFSGDLEEYLLDQFPGRDSFRGLKALTATRAFGLSDNNGLYSHEGVIYRLEYPLDENQVKQTADKIESVIAAHPEMGDVYYSIIPDKNYYSPLRESYPAIDYDAMVALMGESVTSAEYIDIFDCLSIADYYRTDTHWRQERIEAVVKKLSDAMGVPAADFADYEITEAGSFTGILAGQSGLPTKSESMYYLSSPATDGARVESVELEGELPVYSPEKFSGMEPYDIFLSGAQAIMTIENPNAKTDRELIIFRDSYGSSLTPLFIDSYSKITLIDLRYASSSVIGDYADFTDADVLFIYSTMLVNSGSLLR